MILQKLRSSRAGFTLVELAIVLAVAGVLFVGLWRLLSGGNQTVRDESAASQQLELINAVKAFLASSNGQTYISLLGAGATTGLTLPPAANPAGSAGCLTSLTDANEKHICEFLPVGFSVATVNSYNQTYKVQLMTGASAALNGYSFMILTSGGDTIPDSSGGRIAAAIGGDGGFVYAANVCGAGLACGSFGTWSVSPASYGFGAFGTGYTGGHVASRSYITAYASSVYPWLERNTSITGDTMRDYNTMSADMFLGIKPDTTHANIYLSAYNTGTLVGNTTGGGSLYVSGGKIYLGGNPGTGAGGGTLFAQGGSIYLGSDGAPVPTTGGGTLDLQAGTLQMNGGQILDTGGSATISFSTGAARTSSIPVVVGTQCTKVAGGVTGAISLGYNASCVPGIQVNGDQNVIGLLQANQLFAGTFIYQTSDLRLKTDIKPISDSLGEILKLKPVDFAFKSNNQRSMGFIAQDIEKVFPELVSQKPDGMKAVNYEGLIAPMVQAIQELKRENDELRLELQAQKPIKVKD